MKRLLLLGLIVATVVGLAWWLLLPSPLTLGVDAKYPAFGVLYPRRAAGLTAARSVVTALAYCAPSDKRAATYTQLNRALESGAERVDFGFATDRSEPVIMTFDPRAQAPAAPRVLPTRSTLQLETLERGYLLLRVEPAGALVELAARRRWLEAPVADIARQALAATIAVGESERPNQVVATFALEYRTADEAQAALVKLTGKGGVSSLGYVAQPGSRQIVGATKTVTIRYDVNADLVVQALGAR
jgi:hypothetical protein